MDTIKFMIDREEMKITFYITEKQMKDWAKHIVNNNIPVENLSIGITEICYLTSKEICKKLNLDFDKLIPDVIIEKR